MSSVSQLLSRRLRQVRNQQPLYARRADYLHQLGERAHAAEIRKARRKLHQLQAEEKALLSELGLYDDAVTYLPPGASVGTPTTGWRRSYKPKQKRTK